eukprot:scaffold365541_cov26-Attheya_sp.AAC.1
MALSLQEGLESTRQKFVSAAWFSYSRSSTSSWTLNGMKSAERDLRVLTPDGNWPLVLAIATNEEAMISRECCRLIPHHEIPSHLQEKVLQYLGAVMGLD